jgi:hypothetical protein
MTETAKTMPETSTMGVQTRQNTVVTQFLGPAHGRPSDRSHGGMGRQRQARAGLRVATDPRSCAEPVSQPRPPRFFEAQVRPDIADGPPAHFSPIRRASRGGQR